MLVRELGTVYCLLVLTVTSNVKECCKVLEQIAGVVCVISGTIWCADHVYDLLVHIT